MTDLISKDSSLRSEMRLVKINFPSHYEPSLILDTSHRAAPAAGRLYTMLVRYRPDCGSFLINDV